MNKLFKFLILVVYSVFIFAIAGLIINNSTKGNRFNKYSDKPYDDFLTLNVQMLEIRKSKEQTKKEFEQSNYDMYLFVTKKQEDCVITNLYAFVSIKTKKDNYGYSETTSAMKMDKGTYTNYSMRFLNSSTSFAFKSVTNEEGKIKVDDNTPDYVYIKLSYEVTANGNTTKKELNYCNKITKFNEKKLDLFENRSVSTSGIIENKGESFNLKMDLTHTSATNTEVGTDNFKINSLEFNKNNSSQKEIENIHLTAFGLIENQENISEKYFSKYIRLFEYYGALGTRSISVTRTNNVDENYEVEKIFISVVINFTNGDFQETNFYVQANNL